MVRSSLLSWRLPLLCAVLLLLPGLMPQVHAAELHSQFAVVLYDDPTLYCRRSENQQFSAG